MRTNIALDEKLVHEATLLTDFRTKRELIVLLLQELICSRRKKTCSTLLVKPSLLMILIISNCANFGMILIDTSILINKFRDKTQRYSQHFYEYIGEQEIVLTRFQQLQLLQGCGDENGWAY